MINTYIKNIKKTCHKYDDEEDKIKNVKICKENKKILINELKKITNIDFYLTEKFWGKIVFICAKRKNNINELKRIIKENNFDLVCSSLSYNQLIHYKNKAFNNKKIKSKKYGCYHCLNIFDSKELMPEYYEEKSVFEYHNNTYICPFCGNESVIYELPNRKITRNFLYEIELFVYGIKFNLEKYRDRKKYFNVITLSPIEID